MATKSHFIDGQWVESPAGQPFRSTDPATAAPGEVVWEAPAATPDEVDRAVVAARKAAESWASLPVPQRTLHLERFAQQLKDHRSEVATSISRKVGKPTWEALSEVDSMINKVPMSIAAFNERRQPIEHETSG